MPKIRTCGRIEGNCGLLAVPLGELTIAKNTGDRSDLWIISHVVRYTALTE